MQQSLVWKPWDTPGVEHLNLDIDSDGVNASSHLLQNIRGNSIAAAYLLKCDERWRFRQLWLKVDNHGQRRLELRRDLRGQWFLNGEPRDDLRECQQVMLCASPFTHTPALQRCALEAGQSEQLSVAHVDLLNLRVEARQQRYHCLRQTSSQTIYRSEMEGRPSCELTVDQFSLLQHANKQFVRVSQRTLRLNTWV